MFYTQSVEESLLDLDCTPDGLTTYEAKQRSEHYGKNRLPEAQKRTLITIFIELFKSPIIYVLLIAAIVSFSIKEFTDAGFILAVLFINAFIGTYQEYTAGQKADALKKVLVDTVCLIRDTEKRIYVSDAIYWDKDTDKLMQNSKEVPLRNKEGLLLKLLFSKPNHSFSAEDIFNYLHSDKEEKEFSSHSITSLMKRLRTKIPDEVIHNIYGSGYKVIPI